MLIWWDQSGTIITAPIYYQQDPALLDFFIHYDQAERLVRGHDDSIHKATPAETWKAVCTNNTFLTAQDLLIVTVSSQGCKFKCSEYVIKPPIAHPYTPPSCVTHTSIAYDIQRDYIVFFKDSWRVACNGIGREGWIYAMLNSKGVHNIPCCSASSDVGNNFYHSTYTSQYADVSWMVKPSHKFTPYWHHQLILDNISKRLEIFECSKDMMCTIQAALMGVYPPPSSLLNCWLTIFSS